MRIAQVAPLYESVPPKAYGGTERVVSYLTEELVRRGHEVTLFASGDSVTTARLVAPTDRSLRLDPSRPDPLMHHFLLLERVFREAQQFDVIHFHCDYLHFPISRRVPVVSLTTLHGRLDLPGLRTLFREYRDMPVVSISRSQRSQLPVASWTGTVHHGLPADLYRFQEWDGTRDRGYLAVLGRISPEKRVDLAIEIATRAGWPLKIAAKVDPADREYFEAVVKPLLDRPGIEYIGEIGENEKQDFLSGAAALLFPIDWPEPFGLVMIEAMACGTPVIAFGRGSVPEVITPGISGFIVDGVAGAVAAVGRLASLNRRDCRAEFERRFTVAHMAANYLDIYRRLTGAAQVGRRIVPVHRAVSKPERVV
jgi:glycosyltransferase involved in cell wall biosynthesis